MKNGKRYKNRRANRWIRKQNNFRNKGTFQNLVSVNLEQINEDLRSLEPLQRLKMIIELSKFVVPISKATELTTTRMENRFSPITIVKPDEYND